MTKEVMKQALEALRMPCEFWNKTQFIKVTEAIKALEEALKQEQEYEVLAGIGKGVEIPAGWKYYYIKPKLSLQQKQEQDEPVGKFAKFTDGIWREVTDGSAGVPLYTHPKEWVGLTKEDIDEIIINSKNSEPYFKAIEAKLKEKNA